MGKFFKIFFIVLFLALLGIVGYYFFNRKKALNIIIPSIDNIENIHIKFLGDTALVDLDLDVTNKGLFKIHIDTLAYHIRFDTNTLLSKSEFIGLELSKGQKDTIRLPLKLPYKRLMAQIKSLQGQDSVNIPIDVRVVYSTIVGKAVLPYSKNLRIEVPHPPKFEVEKIEYLKREKKDIYLDAHIKMHNYGKIDLDIMRLSYTLTAEDLFAANGSENKEIRVKPKSVIQATLPIKVELKKVFKTIGRVITNNDKVKYHLVIHGFVKTKKDSDDETPIQIEKDGILELKK